MSRRNEGWKVSRDARTGLYTLRFRHAGRRYHLSTGTADSDEAALNAAQLYAETVSGRRRSEDTSSPTVARRPLDGLGAEWLAQAGATLDETTSSQYGMYVERHWKPFFATLDRLTAPAIEDYKAQRLRQVRRGTLKKELSALRGFLRWCVERGLLAEAPDVASPPPKATGTPDTRKRHKLKPVEITEDEARAVIAHLPEWYDGPRATKPYPVRARFEVAWETGLRPATLEALRAPEDYRKGGAVLVIRDEADKARFGREVPLTDGARAALDRVCPDEGPIFGHHDYRDTLRKAARAADLPAEKAEHLSPYDFRHGRLTHLAEVAPNLPGIAYLAGHKHVSTTDRYVRRTRRAAEQVLASLGPREYGTHTGHRTGPALPLDLVQLLGAKGGTRTLTGVTPQDPETAFGCPRRSCSGGHPDRKRPPRVPLVTLLPVPSGRRLSAA